MAFYSGVFNTTVNPAKLNTDSFAGQILRLFPNGSAPIFALSSQSGKSQAKSSTHGYFSKTLVFPAAKINAAAGYAGGILVFVVDSTAGLGPKMVLQNPATQENMRIVSVDSATQITVTRAFGRVAAAAILDNADLIMVGTAFEEGSARPAGRGLTLVHVLNYTQIFRNAWAVTDTARASYVQAGFGNVQENKRDCMLLHSVEIESAIIWGQPVMDTTGTAPIHATQGIIDAVEQYAPGNTTTMGATTTYNQLVTAMEPGFLYSTDMGDPKSRMLFGGATAIKVLHDIGRATGQVHIMQGETSFGMQYTSFKFYKGSIYMMEHPLFNGIVGMSGLAVVVDMPALKLAYMDGRDTRPEEYGGTGKNNANGVDGDGGSLTTEFAVELINPYSCAVMYGLTAGIA